MFVQVENDSDLLFPFLGHASWPTGTGVIMIAVTSEPASLSEYHGGMTTGTHGSESVSHGHGGGTLAGCRDVEVEGRAGPGRGVGGDPAQTTVAHWQAPGLAQAIMIAPRAGQGQGQCQRPVKRALSGAAAAPRRLHRCLDRGVGPYNGFSPGQVKTHF